MPKKRIDLLKKNKSWVALLKERVKARLAADKKKKKKGETPDTTRTKDIQRQLKEAGVRVKTDRERAEEKRRKAK